MRSGSRNWRYKRRKIRVTPASRPHQIRPFPNRSESRKRVNGEPVAKIIHNFGRADQLDRQQLVRLCKSIARVCGLIVTDPQEPDTASASSPHLGLADDLKIKETLVLGCPLVIEHLWERLGLKKTLENITTAAGAQIPYERALLAMVANRLCDPESKLGVWERWSMKKKTIV